MDDDNIIQFRPKQKSKDFTTDPYDVSTFNFTMEDLQISMTKEELDMLFNEPMIDGPLDELAEACIDMQCLCEDHPEIAQFATSMIHRFTENMRKRFQNRK